MHGHHRILTIIDGKGTGFGNKISIQTVDLVNAFKHLGHAYNIQEGNPVSTYVYDPKEGAPLIADGIQKWAVCSLEDTTSLYFFLLQRMLDGKEIPHGKRGYYLCSPGQVAWQDIYAALAKALYKKGIIDSPELTPADDDVLEKMGPALGVEGKASVVGKIGGT
jgi:hypothetical protein